MANNLFISLDKLIPSEDDKRASWRVQIRTRAFGYLTCRLNERHPKQDAEYIVQDSSKFSVDERSSVRDPSPLSDNKANDKAR